jgi:hypothetical protein
MAAWPVATDRERADHAGSLELGRSDCNT